MAVMIYWFSRQLEKKDAINQANIDKFIEITKQYSILSEKVSAHLDMNIAKLGEHHLATTSKLEEIHADIKLFQPKRR